MATFSETEEIKIKFGADSKEFERALKNMGGSVDKFNAKVSTAINVSAVAFTALTASVVATTASFVSFEKEVFNLAKTTNESVKDAGFIKLTEDLRDLNKTLPLSSTELLKIATSAGQVGIKGRDNLLKFTEAVAKMGTSTNLSGETAVIALAKIAGNTKLATSEIERLASTIVAVGDNTKGFEDELADMAKELSKSTIAFDLGSANIIGLSSALIDAGVQADVGSTVVGKSFAEIRKAIDKGGASLELLEKVTKKSGDQLKKSFKDDAQGVFVDFLKGIKSIEDAGENSSFVLEKFGLSGAGVNKVLIPLALQAETVAGKLEFANEAFNKGTANQEQFAVFAESSAVKLKLVSNSLETASEKLGQKFLPIILTVAEKLKSVAEYVASWDKGTVKLVSQIVIFTAGLTALVVVVGTITKVVLVARTAMLALSASTALASGGLTLLLGALAVGVSATATYYATREDKAEKAVNAIAEKEIEVEKKKVATLEVIVDEASKKRKEARDKEIETQRVARIKQATESFEQRKKDIKKESKLRLKEAQDVAQKVVDAEIKHLKRVKGEREKAIKDRKEQLKEELALEKGKYATLEEKEKEHRKKIEKLSQDFNKDFVEDNELSNKEALEDEEEYLEDLKEEEEENLLAIKEAKEQNDLDEIARLEEKNDEILGKINEQNENVIRANREFVDEQIAIEEEGITAILDAKEKAQLRADEIDFDLSLVNDSDNQRLVDELDKQIISLGEFDAKSATSLQALQTTFGAEQDKLRANWLGTDDQAQGFSLMVDDATTKLDTLSNPDGVRRNFTALAVSANNVTTQLGTLLTENNRLSDALTSAGVYNTASDAVYNSSQASDAIATEFDPTGSRYESGGLAETVPETGVNIPTAQDVNVNISLDENLVNFITVEQLKGQQDGTL